VGVVLRAVHIAPLAPREYLSPAQAAELLGLSLRTLWKWRRRGTGPAWSRCGEWAVRYRRADVEAWIEAQQMAPVARGPRARNASEDADL
jgi:excisionase family DNA binding protein